MEKASSERERLFFALWPDANWQQAYHHTVKRALRKAQGRWIVADNLHVTLVFLGSVTRGQRERLVAAAAGVEAPRCALEFARLVYRPRNRMVWALPTAAPAALTALAEELRRVATACGLDVERRPFLPHLTLLRKASPIEACCLESPPLWEVRSFSLLRSQTLPRGAVYEVVAEWPPASP